MLVNEFYDFIKLHSAEASGPLKSNRLQPQLRDHLLASHMNVRRLAPIQ
jgi:hypothetical protein